jgi:hypothetical protein
MVPVAATAARRNHRIWNGFGVERSGGVWSAHAELLVGLYLAWERAVSLLKGGAVS